MKLVEQVLLRTIERFASSSTGNASLTEQLNFGAAEGRFEDPAWVSRVLQVTAEVGGEVEVQGEDSDA